MSGIEAAGLVLGAIPLIISALEHYERSHKTLRSWWYFRAKHREDVRRYKDCLVDFRNNLRELLLPLVLEGSLEKINVEVLLASPGGAGWKEKQFEAALSRRFHTAETHERYMHILEDMVKALVSLSKGCHVDDPRFQEMLRNEEQKTSGTSSATQAKTDLKVRASLALEAKRIAYAFTEEKRDYQLADVEKCNDQFHKVLASNDRLSALSQSHQMATQSKKDQKSLDFWKHAKTIFDLIDRSWQCNCRSTFSIVNLWLQRQVLSCDAINMRMQLKLCDGAQAVDVRLSDAPKSIQLTLPTRTKGALSKVSSAPSSKHLRNDYTLSHGSQNLSSSPQSGLSPITASDLRSDGLCKTCSRLSQARSAELCIGSLSTDNDDYDLYRSVGRLSGPHMRTLADIFDSHAGHFSRIDRYGIALTLASSHLQLQSTPWLDGIWSVENVMFPVASDGTVLLREPYILKSIEDNKMAAIQPQDYGFSILGIILLELCFGKRLEDHEKWQEPGFAPLRHDPMIRHAVAVAWCKAVQSEAGDRYAQAVSWTLRPTLANNDNWRADFAKNVVYPLQQTYEFMSS